MGVGKSIQGLGIALYYKSEWPLLLIVPATLVSSNERDRVNTNSFLEVLLVRLNMKMVPLNLSKLNTSFEKWERLLYERY